MGIHRGHQARPLEWLAEKLIALVSLSAILLIFLIFLFVAREAFPILIGKGSSGAAEKIIPVSDLDKLSPTQLQQYLGVTPQQFKELDKEALKALMEVKVEEKKQSPKDKDSAIDPTRWRFLLLPHQWTGYTKPEYIWQPVSQVRKFNIVPLLLGTLKTTFVALVVSVPLALAAAIFVSQLTTPFLREYLKPAIELLAGIPSVVVGFFALIVMSAVFQRLFGYGTPLNAWVAGLALSFAVIPVIFSLAEDALTSVPRSYTHAALALGASKWQAAYSIVVPAALPGIFAAIVLGFGRAIGETMIVLMASGNASIMSPSLFDSTRTITATIAAELAETVFGGTHYRVLFLLGAMLFAATFVSNFVAGEVMHRLKARLEGK